MTCTSLIIIGSSRSWNGGFVNKVMGIFHGRPVDVIGNETLHASNLIAQENKVCLLYNVD